MVKHVAAPAGGEGTEQPPAKPETPQQKTGQTPTGTEGGDIGGGLTGEQGGGAEGLQDGDASMASHTTAPSLGSDSGKNALSRKGYHYAHSDIYYKDGRICEAPKRTESTEADREKEAMAEAQAQSQSRWNFNDYHWEERDFTNAITRRLAEELEGHDLWRDKRSPQDHLAVRRVELDGWAASNVRKGTTKNICEFGLKVHFQGSRAEAGLEACVSITEVSHESDLGNLETEVSSEATIRPPTERTLTQDGKVVDKSVDTPISTDRVMRSHEMLLKLVNRKGVPLVKEKVRLVVEEFLGFKGQS